MMKKEFDKASEEAGFGPCAAYMWPEIEACYSTSDDIDRDLMVDIYWHEPGIYREILGLRQMITDAAKCLEQHSTGYRFPEIRGRINHIANLHERLDKVIADAKRRAANRMRV